MARKSIGRAAYFVHGCVFRGVLRNGQTPPAISKENPGPRNHPVAGLRGEKMKYDDKDILKTARNVLDVEHKALELSRQSLDEGFLKAVKACAETKGRVVVLGIGKSGLIGRKISATLASTGTPSFFVHPVEALHGDLGMIASGDVILALSFSGQTEEINKILPSLSRRRLTIISMTGHENSKLALMSDIHVKIYIDREACPYGLAPTASTTATLAVGDALAVCLMKIKHFEKSDFALFHPGGSLGKLLTQQVKDLMRKGKNNPVVGEKATVKDALLVMTKSNAAGATSVVDKKGKLLGYFTDGDLRRELQRGEDVINKKIAEVMTRQPYHILDTAPAIEAAKMIHATHVDNIPVLDKTGKVVGIIDEKDLIEFIAMLDKKA